METWLFIIGYVIQVIGSSLLLLNIIRRKSVYGLSSDTQLCLLLSTLSRLYWSMETRLVETKFAYAELCGSTIISLLLCLAVWRYRHTTTKEAWWPFRSCTLIPICILLALMFHPGPNRLSTQILVAFSMYIEAAALVPQLYLMRKMIEVEPLTSHYVSLLILSRVARVCFWISLYRRGEHFIGLFLADLFHTILAGRFMHTGNILGDYMFVWCRKLRTGGALIYKI